MAKVEIDYTFFNEIAQPIITDEKYLSMKEHIAHSNYSTYAHSIHVAKLSYAFAIKHKIKCDIKSLIRGALLHDYFLYDWHNNAKGTWHGFKHAKIALANAKEKYNLTKTEENIIKTHMFPLNIFDMPTCKEAWIVTLMDKKSASIETFKKYKKGYIKHDIKHSVE